MPSNRRPLHARCSTSSAPDKSQDRGRRADIEPGYLYIEQRMLNRYALILMLFCVGNVSAETEPRRYLAGIDDSLWYISDNSATLCRVEHRIPRFGSAIFTQEAGRPLHLELQSQVRFERGVNVELRSETTRWNQHQPRRVLARFETNGKRSMFRIPPAVAEQAWSELSRGFQPGFLFYTDHPLMVSLDNVRFGQAEKNFNDCVANLYRDNFRDVRVSSIHFEPDSEFASLEQEGRAFVRMLDYLEVDDSISEIVVTGHTDNTGKACYNEGLSERRAWYVYDLLIGLGIDAGLLHIDHAGEAKPSKKNNSDGSRAANRRVTVELRR